MDEEENTRQLKLLGIGVLMFVMSLYFSWTELRYLIWSHVATADVVEVNLQNRGEDSEKQQVKYAFTDAAGKRHQQTMHVSTDEPVSAPGKIEIRYLATDPPVARFADDWNWMPFLMLIASSIGLGWFLRAMHRAANA